MTLQTALEYSKVGYLVPVGTSTKFILTMQLVISYLISKLDGAQIFVDNCGLFFNFVLDGRHLPIISKGLFKPCLRNSENNFNKLF